MTLDQDNLLFAVGCRRNLQTHGLSEVMRVFGTWTKMDIEHSFVALLAQNGVEGHVYLVGENDTCILNSN